MTPKPWDGNIERRRSPTDHDSVVRLLAMFAEHIKNFDNHVLDDKSMYKKIDFHSKMIYVGMGAIGMLQFVLLFTKH